MAQPADSYGPYQPPYAMPRYGTGAGDGPGGSTPYIGGAGDPSGGRLYPGGSPSFREAPAPGGSVGSDGVYSPPYIGGAGDPNAGRLTGPSPSQIGTEAGGTVAPPSIGGTNYGPYLGWDQGKLNDPTHNTPKYQFLRAMLDAGISSQNRDLSGAVGALKARGYDVDAVPGSSDQIRWGNQGTYDIFNGTNGDFWFGEQNAGGAPSPGAQPSMPSGVMPYLPPYDPSGMHAGNPDKSQPQSVTGSSYAQPQALGSNYFGQQAYRPPYLQGAV